MVKAKSRLRFYCLAGHSSIQTTAQKDVMVTKCRRLVLRDTTTPQVLTITTFLYFICVYCVYTLNLTWCSIMWCGMARLVQNYASIILGIIGMKSIKHNSNMNREISIIYFPTYICIYSHDIINSTIIQPLNLIDKDTWTPFSYVIGQKLCN